MHVLQSIIAAVRLCERLPIDGCAQQFLEVALHELPRPVDPAGAKRNDTDLIKVGVDLAKFFGEHLGAAVRGRWVQRRSFIDNAKRLVVSVGAFRAEVHYPGNFAQPGGFQHMGGAQGVGQHGLQWNAARIYRVRDSGGMNNRVKTLQPAGFDQAGQVQKIALPIVKAGRLDGTYQATVVARDAVPLLEQLQHDFLPKKPVGASYQNIHGSTFQ
ncbi:hypothetical protein D3C77_486880 [compost metagenome]